MNPPPPAPEMNFPSTRSSHTRRIWSMQVFVVPASNIQDSSQCWFRSSANSSISPCSRAKRIKTATAFISFNAFRDSVCFQYNRRPHRAEGFLQDVSVQCRSEQISLSTLSCLLLTSQSSQQQDSGRFQLCRNQFNPFSQTADLILPSASSTHNLLHSKDNVIDFRIRSI